MSNVHFKDYLNGQLQEPEFREAFNNETAKLESAIARIESGANTCRYLS